ncbi:transposase [Aequorivita ciconiae]|nr:transposase [Aequorivita sp. H23M31]
MVDFRYDKIKDTYTCPADQVLATNGSIYDKAGHKVKHYKNREACGACPVRALCTTNKNGRFIERSIYQEALDENQKRVEARPEYYRLRQQVTEHQFGTLKRQWGFTHTLMRGKQNVLSEVDLMMICYNLTRLVSILGPEVLKNRLKRLVPGFSALFEAILAHMNSFLLPRNTYPNFKPTRNTVLTAL